MGVILNYGTKLCLNPFTLSKVIESYKMHIRNMQGKISGGGGGGGGGGGELEGNFGTGVRPSFLNLPNHIPGLRKK